MARRSSRRSKKTSKKASSLSPATLRTIAGVGAALIVIIVLVQFMSPKTDKVDLTPTSSFRIDDYRRDGSRFATPGNTYVLEAKVENIDTRGNDKLLSVSLPSQSGKNDRLPLMLRDGKSGRVNVTRGDTFLFEVTCRNGQDAEGKPVKGILMVNSVHNK